MPALSETDLPMPRHGRDRALRAVLWGCLVWLCAVASVDAQSRAELERALTVTRELPGCVSASALRARTAQYLGRAEQLSELTIEVDLQVPQFRVLRGGTVLAERRFARAPSECSERRDAVALAVAIAIEQAAEQVAADSGEPAPLEPQPSAASRFDTTASAGGRADAPRETSEDSRSARTAGAVGGQRDRAPDEDARANAQRGEDARAAGRTADANRGNAQRGENTRAAGRTAEANRGNAQRGENARAADANRAGRPPQADERAPDDGARALSTRRSSPPSRVDAPAGGRDDSATAQREPAKAPQDAPARGSGDPPPSAADEGVGPHTRIAVLGGGAVLFEALPTAAAAFSLGAELAVLPALRIALSGMFSPPISSAFQGGKVSAQLYGAQLTGCLNLPAFSSVLVHGCAGAVGGVIEARGDDFALNLSDQMGWLAGLVRARLEFPAAGRVAASVYADGRVNLLRPELQAALGGEPARTQAVRLLGGGLGVELIVRLY